MKRLLALLVVGLAINARAAASYSIDWFTVDGGGGTSTGGSYSLSGTIGQPDAGRLSGGSYVVNGGVLGGRRGRPGAPPCLPCPSPPQNPLSSRSRAAP